MSRCGSETAAGAVETRLDIPFVVPEQRGTLTVARIALRYSLLGQVAKPLFRSTEAYLNLNYADGSKQRLRIVPELLDEGILIAPVPQNPDGMLTLLKGGTLSKVMTASISGSTHRFVQEFKVTFYRIPFTGS